MDSNSRKFAEKRRGFRICLVQVLPPFREYEHESIAKNNFRISDLAHFQHRAGAKRSQPAPSNGNRLID